MSTFRYPIEIGDSNRERFERLEAWVDTGASYSRVPQQVLERLGFSPESFRRFRTADGRIVERGVCQVPLRLGQETLMVLCVFGDDQSEPLLGATALEEFALGVDPIHHTLVPVVSNLLGFSPEAHDNEIRS